MATDLSPVLPRVLIVSRRAVRKNKIVDFVGEYHLDLLVRYGVAPVIVPRVKGMHMLLESLEPIHGVLLCEGEDIDPSLYESQTSCLSPEDMKEIQNRHSSDTSLDREKDTIELKLTKLCLERGIPYLGICRGSQLLNVVCGGTLYQDIGKELSVEVPVRDRTVHIDYGNYDLHRHLVRVVEKTPLHDWFRGSMDERKMEILVNSYHHQGVKRLAQRFKPMAFAPDGLVEGFFDPDAYNPEAGRFLVGLQFHPERMRHQDSEEFDYPGCPFIYHEFVRAAVAYQKKISCAKSVPKSLKLERKMGKRRVIIRSFLPATDLQYTGRGMHSSKGSGLEPGTKFLEEDRERFARDLMAKMSKEQLSELISFYHTMEKICSEVLEKELQGFTTSSDL